MASHHHCPRHLNSHPATITTITTAAAAAPLCGCSCCSAPSHHPLAASDPLLYSTPPNAFLSAPSLPHHPQFYSPYFNPPNNVNHFHTPPETHHQFRQQHFPCYQREEQNNPTVSSLVTRIAALESSFRRHSSPSFSLRDAAARIIQTHFRAFLVRRSRTLRHLKDLASIKSTLNTLKSAISDTTLFDPRVLSRKSVDLLLKLDSIQGGDPMIRDGKRSISRELVQFIEFVDGVSAKQRDISGRAVKNVRITGNGNKSGFVYSDCITGSAVRGYLGGENKKLMKKLSGRQVVKNNGLSLASGDSGEECKEHERPDLFVYEKQHKSGASKKNGGVQAKVKRSVSFAENENVYRVFRSSSPESVSSEECNNSTDGSDSANCEGELLDEMCGEAEETGKESEDEEVQIEAGGSPHSNDGGRSHGRNLRTEIINEQGRLDQIEQDSFVFSAPLPAKMETRAALLNKRKTMKMALS